MRLLISLVAVWMAIQLLARPSVSATAVNYSFSSEDTITEQWESVIGPVFYSSKNGTFVGIRNITIPYHFYYNKCNKDTVVVLAGRGESYIKFREVIYDFFTNGYNVLTYDQRGQGFSTPRPCPSTPALEASESFIDYVTDLETIVSLAKSLQKYELQFAHSERKIFLFGHSMGGAVGGLYLARNPKTVSGAVLTSPMMELSSAATIKAYAVPIVAAGGTCALFPGASTVADTDISEANFLKSQTSSRNRWFAEKNVEWGQFPETAMAGNAASWLLQAVYATEWVRGNASKVVDPVLLLQAQNDSAVLPGGQEVFCTNNATKAKNCVLQVWEGSKHEIWNERDVIRTPALTAVLNFFRSL